MNKRIAQVVNSNMNPVDKMSELLDIGAESMLIACEAFDFKAIHGPKELYFHKGSVVSPSAQIDIAKSAADCAKTVIRENKGTFTHLGGGLFALKSRLNMKIYTRDGVDNLVAPVKFYIGKFAFRETEAAIYKRALALSKEHLGKIRADQIIQQLAFNAEILRKSMAIRNPLQRHGYVRDGTRDATLAVKDILKEHPDIATYLGENTFKIGSCKFYVKSMALKTEDMHLHMNSIGRLY